MEIPRVKTQILSKESINQNWNFHKDKWEWGGVGRSNKTPSLGGAGYFLQQCKSCIMSSPNMVVRLLSLLCHILSPQSTVRDSLCEMLVLGKCKTVSTATSNDRDVIVTELSNSFWLVHIHSFIPSPTDSVLIPAPSQDRTRI